MTVFHPESKAVKKNKKRKSGGKKSDSTEHFEISEDISAPTAVPTAAEPPSIPIDPITNLKKQIEEAKAAKVDYTYT